MLRAVLLDLDNTMVLYDEPGFYHRYFSTVCTRFTDMFEPAEFQERVIRATMALRQNRGELNNRHFFMNVFAKGHPGREEEIWQRFMSFYRTEYPNIQVEKKVPEALHHTINQLQHDGLKLVVASNPIFPVIALEERMSWAGIDKVRFDLLTHIENMSYVKPRVEYYLQISEIIGEAPEDCLMVGNDPVNDMVAGGADMKTFLTTDGGELDYTSVTLTYDQPTEPQHIPEPDFSGPFSEVAGVVRELRY
jgi:FMN phosphatase YigB (HAD superfamily)